MQNEYGQTRPRHVQGGILISDMSRPLALSDFFLTEIPGEVSKKASPKANGQVDAVLAETCGDL